MVSVVLDSVTVDYSSAGPYWFKLPVWRSLMERYYADRESGVRVLYFSLLERYLADHESVRVPVRFEGGPIEIKTYGEILRDIQQGLQIAAEERANAEAKQWAERRAVEERARMLAKQRAEERKSRRGALNRELGMLSPSTDAASSEVFSALDDRIAAHSDFTAEYASLQVILLGPHSSLTRSEAKGLLYRLQAIHSKSATIFPKSVPDFLARLELLIREVCDQRDAERAAKQKAWLQEQSQKSNGADHGRRIDRTPPKWV